MLKLGFKEDVEKVRICAVLIAKSCKFLAKNNLTDKFILFLDFESRQVTVQIEHPNCFVLCYHP